MKIGITAGDPAGIGLEIILKGIPSFLSRAAWVLFGETADFEANLHRFAPDLPWSPITDLESVQTGRLGFSSTGNGPAAPWGQGTTETGRRALAALEAGGQGARSGELAALVTAPLSKELVGPGFSGQTGFLRAHSGSARAAMSFFTRSFKVVLATTHLSLRDAVSSLSRSSYVDLIGLIDSEFQRYGYDRPRIAVAAVNPHAGEGGMFGTEDDHILKPAVLECGAGGIRVSGPYPADSVYQRAHAGEFDIVLAPYHDQGLIPVKLIAPRSAANVTLGLPYVRTSPDHGTAFAIAGLGAAETGGMETAFEWALELASRLEGTKT